MQSIKSATFKKFFYICLLFQGLKLLSFSGKFRLSEKCLENCAKKSSRDEKAFCALSINTFPCQLGSRRLSLTEQEFRARGKG